LFAGSKNKSSAKDASFPHSQTDSTVPSAEIGMNLTQPNESIPAFSATASLDKQQDCYFRKVAAIGVQTASALDYAHQNGTLHRDIKPANLIIDTKGVVWILDFGLAKAGEHGLTSPGDIIGTIRYMAPERFYGNADERSDIYSLGLTLYELATLQYAFDANDRAALIQQVTNDDPKSPRTIDENIPRDLDTIIMKSLERSPNRRYDSSAELAEDLRLFLSDQPIQARRISPAERIWRICRRNPVVSGLAAALLAMLILVVLGSSRFAYISNIQKNDALELERSTRYRRYELNYESARAVRKSDQLGRRFEALSSIAEAVNLLPTLGLSTSEVSEERARLRTEAAAALGQFDLQAEETWDAPSHIERGVAFNSDHTRFAQPFANGDIRIFDRSNRTLQAILRSEHGQAWHLDFSHDDRYLLSVNQGKKSVVSVWDLSTVSDDSGIAEVRPGDAAAPIKLTKPFIEVESHWSGKGVFSADGTTVALSTKESVELFDLQSGNRKATIECGYAPKSLQISADASQVMTAELRATEIHRWITRATSEVPAQTIELPAGSDGVYSLCWDSEREILVAGLADGNLLVWNQGLLDAPSRFPVHKHTVVRIHLHPQRRWIFTQGWDETVRVFDLVTKRQLTRLERHALMPSGISRDGSQIGLSCVENENIGVWKIWKPCLSRIPVDQTDLKATSVFRFAAQHPSRSDLLLTAHEEGIFFFDTRNRKPLAKLTGYGNTSPAFSADGNSLFIFAEDSSIKMPLRIIENGSGLSVEFGESQRILGPIPDASTFTLSQDQSQLLVVVSANSGNATTKLISLNPTSSTDSNTATDSISFGPHRGASSAHLSSDASWLATSSWKEKGIKIWRAEDGQQEKTLLPDLAGTHSRFSDDGRFLITAQRANLYVWEVGTWEPVDFAVSRRLGIMGDIASTESLLACDYTRFVPQLVDLNSKRWLMRLESSLEDTQRSYAFNADGSQLIIAGTEYTHIWDLKQVRERLTELKLDW
ncbi:MAG: serine/threonine-protein kinase, partial [Planctomycetota bacterium]